MRSNRIGDTNFKNKFMYTLETIKEIIRLNNDITSLKKEIKEKHGITKIKISTQSLISYIGAELKNDYVGINKHRIEDLINKKKQLEDILLNGLDFLNNATLIYSTED